MSKHQMSSTPKTVLITGCSAGGMGAALAELFQEKGFHVFATARTPSKISTSLAKASNVTILTLDVLSSESIAAAVESVSKETGGKLDVLVNNSGTGIILPALDTSIEDGKKLFELNFWAVLATIQAFSPLLIRAKGCIVNNTSVAGAMPLPYGSLYNASKAALLIGSETWRLELAPLGVRTLTLVTGGVKTQFFTNITEKTVPENSYYSSIRDFIHDQYDGRAQANGITGREFAIRVVREVEKGTVGELWVGAGASYAHWGLRFLPRFLIDKLLENMYPVSSKIANDVQSRKA